MKIKKRNGSLEDLSLNKIVYRIRNICNDSNLGELKGIDPDIIAQKVTNRIYDGISSSEIDDLTGNITIALATENPFYGDIASRITVSNMHKNTNECFSEVMEFLYNNTDVNGDHSPIVSDSLMKSVRQYKDDLDSYINHDRDYNLNYFGYKTLEKSYLMRVHTADSTIIVERPQHMFMRVSIAIHSNDIDKIKETYDLMSQGYFIHATPTLFNAGTPRPQMSSCFLIDGGADSVDGIYKTITDCAKISKWAGGIGFHIHDIRGKNSKIRGSNGISDGIIPMLRVFNSTARYINQSGKRTGSFACYIEPWHVDIKGFLDMKKNHGDEEQKARDLFYALWIPDLFMEKVKNDEDWFLMCPDESKGLSSVYSTDFNILYNKYVDNGFFKEKIKARDLWKRILDSQTETGTPYMLYKDSCNIKSNQKNLGTIKSSNLCAEIIEYTSPDETAVCNLASIALPKFVIDSNTFDFDKLKKVVKVVVKNLDTVIDVNFYPIPEAKNSNFKHRPIGLGVQGLADTYMKMKIPFDSTKALALNKKIFESIQFAALESSMEISKLKGTYSSYEHSPVSKGVFQHNMWGVDEKSLYENWDGLRSDIMKYGIRNSLLTALMPTASTSQILGNSECIEPLQSNIFMRRTLSGEFPVVNKYLINDLFDLGLWNKHIRDEIVKNSGSIQNISDIPDDLKSLYKTVWELSQKVLINQSADRAAFIDQSQSLNLFMAQPTHKKLTSMHFYSWEKGLKTGQYYLRTKAAKEPIQFTIEPEKQNDHEACDMCSG
jgi:ribonucleoside-diphosphate reductase alpha subunit